MNVKVDWWDYTVNEEFLHFVFVGDMFKIV